MPTAPRNYDIAELKRLDVAHHLPAQQDYKVIEEMGGSRIITHADGCYIFDGDGNRILDGDAHSPAIPSRMRLPSPSKM